MKRMLFSILLLGGFIATQAAGYDYLVLEKTDGTTLSLTATGLTITFSDGNLVASDGTNIALTSLTKMYFSDTSGIRQMTVKGAQGTLQAFTVSGRQMGTFANLDEATGALPKGIYVIKDSSGNTHKIAVR